ncbi:MAG: PASTA domain-containing protein, partial [Acidimicrobiales bacterium]
AAGTVRPEDRLDATGLARGLHQTAEGLPPPGLLPLAGPVVTADVEGDSHPTEVAGGPRLFDAEAAEAAEAAATFPAAMADEGDGGDGGDGGLAGRRRRVPRWAWIIGVVALLVAAGAAAYVLTRPPPSHPVPSLRGDTEAQAAAALAPLRLHLDVTGRVYDPNAPAGTVLSQTPAPTSGLHEGGRVHAVVSKGPQPVNVPKLAGQTPDEAKAVLTTLGLRLGTVTPAASATVPEGQIISTTPAVGTALPGQAVDVVVSSGKPFVTVPLLAGAQVASYAAAQAALAGVGLAPAESDQFSDTVPKGQVIGTSPAPGVSVRQDTPITVKISKGPDLVAVPSVAQQSVGAASQAMAAAGLSVSGVTGDPTKTVTGSNPPAGAMLHRGSAVQLVT